ncbi:hypothetical protein BDP27DRAFT_1502952 [Rhodocollybia butyracea]|uniref:BHLH domain-containing protein n=1 Tax=Rhodocollybia butyracea TaxID=206335 RepID=A0A9P5U8W0_9AGAR|nr:hypothetical protein BDP27DRAFT_1502952 [Rhodocollybia butyracea]
MSFGFDSILSHSSFVPLPLDNLMDYPQSSQPDYFALGQSSSSMTVPHSSLADYDYTPLPYNPRLENAIISHPTLATNMRSDGPHAGRHNVGFNLLPSSPSVPNSTTGHRSTATRASSPTAKSPDSKAVVSNADSDEGEDRQSVESADPILQEAVRRRRVASDQKRRDDLRDGFTYLKSTLPPVNPKFESKAKVLHRAARHIGRLEAKLETAKNEIRRLETANDELNAYRLRDANEARAWDNLSSY